MPRRHLVALLLIIPVVLVFFGVLDFQFLQWDDDNNILNNPHIQSLAGLGSVWRQPYQYLYIPVVYTVWAFVAAFARLPVPQMVDGETISYAAAPFHAANLIVHCLNVLLVYAIVCRVTGTRGGALLAAALFGLHPVQVEPVSWITGLKDLLGGFLSLSTICFYLGSLPRAEAESPPQKAPLYLAAATATFVLALLAKPSAAILPAVVLVLHLSLAPGSPRHRLAPLCLWFVLAAGLVLFTRSAQPLESDIQGVSPLQRLAVAGDAIGFYLGKVAWPANLAFDYGRSPEKVLASGAPPLKMAVCVLAFALTAILWRRRPTWALPPAIFLLGLTPVLGFVPFAFQSISTVADRYLYFALLGPALAVGFFWRAAVTRGNSVRIALAIAGGALCLVFGFISMQQTEKWRSDAALFQNALLVNPDSWIAHYHLADSQAKRGDDDLAFEHAEAAARLAPRIYFVHTLFGNLLMQRRAFPEAEAEFRRAVAAKSDVALPHYLLAAALQRQGRLPEAKIELNQAIKAEPNWTPARDALARLESTRPNPP